MSRSRGLIAIAATLAALIIVAAAARRVQRDSHVSRAPAPAAAATAAAPPSPARPPALAAGSAELAVPAALPASLEGTEVDGAAAVTADGHLIVDRNLRRLFDYFLSATGEEPLATIRARIIDELHRRLPPAAATAAIAVLDRYLGYRDAARTLTPIPGQAGLEQLHALRARWFSADEAMAFFGDEEALTAAAVARAAVIDDHSLSADERQRRLAEIQAQLPADVRASLAAATAPIDEMAREKQLRADGASDDQIAAARTSAFGPEAAARLADLDRQHAAWDARLAAFRARRAQLLADPSLSPDERQRQIGELLARSFTPAEQIRVETLDRIAAGGH